jgi:DNA invertase Pin-like site-specific DNA recombinase
MVAVDIPLKSVSSSWKRARAELKPKRKNNIQKKKKKKKKKKKNCKNKHTFRHHGKRPFNNPAQNNSNN